MQTTPEAYTHDEMMGLAANALPSRGTVCPKCGAVIPQFVDLTEKDEARLRQLIRENRKLAAVQELRTLTRCPVAWAKIWVEHSGHPDAVGTTAPCPYCGKQLKTALAKQCHHCNMDWHDPKNPKKLGASRPGDTSQHSMKIN
jgi:hypothetical protein